MNTAIYKEHVETLIHPVLLPSWPKQNKEILELLNRDIFFSSAFWKLGVLEASPVNSIV